VGGGDGAHEKRKYATRGIRVPQTVEAFAAKKSNDGKNRRRGGGDRSANRKNNGREMDDVRRLEKTRMGERATSTRKEKKQESAR